MLSFNGILSIFLGFYILELFFFCLLEKLNRYYLEHHGSLMASRFRGYIDEERLARINAYTRDKSHLATTHKLLSDLFLLGLILVGVLPLLDRQCVSWNLPVVWTGLLFFGMIGFVFYVLDLPFDYFRTFVIEERYGFNRSTFRLWLTDHVKAGLLSVLLLGPVLGAILWVIQSFPDTWWLLALAIVSGFQIVLMVLYPILIAPLFNRFEPLKNSSLAERLKDLLERAGVRIKEISQMDAGRRSQHTNAYFTGLGKTKRVVLFDTLIHRHTHEEILAVLAHEAGHFMGKHLIKQWFVFSTSMLIVLYLTSRLIDWPTLHSTFAFDGPRPYVGLLLIGIFWQKAGFFIIPFYMALTRHWEREADRFAVHIMNEPGPFVTALKRMAADNLSNLAPHPVYVWFNATHPPLAQRIAMLEGIGQSPETVSGQSSKAAFPVGGGRDMGG
jgi:STE24 endopeptidase